jgi:histidyl-tRNA synthetase
VEQLGGKPTPAIGFALGEERLVALLEDLPLPPDYLPHAYLVLAGETAELQGRLLAETLRTALPGLRLLVNSGGGSFKAQLKRADKSGARLALILGEDEALRHDIGIKDLREGQPQQVVEQARLADELGRILALEQVEQTTTS